MIPPNYPIVAVGFPIAISGVYDYRIPDTLMGRIRPGTPVLVEIRNRKLWGVAVRLKEKSEYDSLKPVLEVNAERWTEASEGLVKLYEWMAAYYQCGMGAVFKPFVRKSLLGSKEKRMVAYHPADSSEMKLTVKQSEAIERIRAGGQENYTTAELQAEFGISRNMAETLCRKGLLTKGHRIVARDTAEMEQAADLQEYELTDEQKAAVEEIDSYAENPEKPFLLHGITGSGKTLVYIELVRRCLQRGKGVIVLVPEISLTPQTVWRFKTGIGNEVTVLHSRMSGGERRDSLDRLVKGEKKVVIGARSAVLAPMENVGLIIVDEEHDGSYKQSEIDPRYNARDVAVMRGSLGKALVVLGSATPSLESYYNAQQGKYRLLTLQSRFGGAVLPTVEIADMAREHREKNWTPLSRLLRKRISEVLEMKRQCVLLLNRRGFSSSLICKDCGHTHECPFCSVKLTFHRTDIRLKCHQCGYEQSAPDKCPECRGEQIKYQGTGIQKAEEILNREFPGIRVLRMDQDSTRRKGAHVSLLDSFASYEADILLGTQMVAKGLDFPGVTLVGVLNADIGLGLPDFRAAERTFQLLTQVAGRAGRGENPGKVVIQTYFPEENAILCAQGHDYLSFSQSELEARQALGYPPYGRVVRLVSESTKENAALAVLNDIAGLVHDINPQVAILGPAPAAIAKISSQYRFSLVLKSARAAVLQRTLFSARSRFPRIPRSVKLTIDVDPVSML